MERVTKREREREREKRERDREPRHHIIICLTNSAIVGGAEIGGTEIQRLEGWGRANVREVPGGTGVGEVRISRVCVCEGYV